MLIVTADDTIDDITEAITWLRQAQTATHHMRQTMIAGAIDDMLDELLIRR